ncbi:MAG: glycoside hydrolase family 31 protein [Woeseiaceae bacterium]|nr:glycoside hydrolase family 31 protein [Woeseiaceae bacterium]
MNYRRVRHAALAALACLFAVPASADFGEYESHVWEGQSLIITTTEGDLRITALNDGALEVFYHDPDVRQLPSFAIDGEPAQTTTVLSESDSALSFATHGLTAIVNKSPVSIRYVRDGEDLVAEEHGYFAFDTVRGFRFALDEGEKIMGGGQRVLGMDRRGNRMPLYNRAHYGYTTQSNQMYYSLPAIMSSDRYIIAFDNTASGWLDIGSTEADVLQFEAVGGRTSYIVATGDSYPELIEHFTDATGRQPLPPRWAFGNYASRFGYRTEEETRDVVQRFQREEIPLDTVIIDLYWFGPDIKGHMGNLDWDRDAFPTPEDMIADFAEDGIKTIAITEPFILTSSDRWQDAVDNEALARNATGGPKTFNFYFGNTGLIDIFDENARDWFWEPYEMLFEQGAAGTWGDLGEPEVHPGDALHWLSGHDMLATGDEVHNAYGHEWACMVYENQVAQYPDVRPVIVMRSGFLGTQRCGIIPWTGDVSRSWGGFKPQVELSLQMSLFGVAYTHSDLGGFAGGDSFDKELYIRWLQYGVFQPVYRPHANESIPPEAVFHDRETRQIVGDFIRLRYALLPYIYTMAWENSTTGMPLMRPLFFEDDSDPALIDEKQAFLWGDAFLVSPLTDPGIESHEVPLPGGIWFDFWDDTRYEGGQTASIPVTLETTPVLVRAGSFIPMADVVQTTEDYSSESLTLHYYADETVRSSTGRMYEDDGESRTSLEDGAFEMLQFSALQTAEGLSFEFSRSGGEYEGMPERREITLIVHNCAQPPESISVNGNDIPLSGRLPRDGAGATADDDASTVTLRFSWHQPGVEVNMPGGCQ